MQPFFISYPRSDQDSVNLLLATLKKKGVPFYSDAQLTIGDWEEQLVKEALPKAVGVIAVITGDVVNRSNPDDNESYVRAELRIAQDLGTKYIFPILLGNVSPDSSLDALLGTWHRAEGANMTALLDSNTFLAHLERLKKIASGMTPDQAKGISGGNEGDPAALWPVSGEDVLARQALLLTVTMLEGEPPFLVSDMAAMIEARIAQDLRAETREERAARPRHLGQPSLGERLASIGVERQRISVGTRAGQEIVRFTDLNRRGQILEHIWHERPEVRRVLVDCMDHMSAAGRVDLLRAMLRGLMYLAQIDLPGLRYTILDRWMRPELTEVQLTLLSHVLASAWNAPGNRDLVRRILRELRSGETIPTPGPESAHLAREAALLVALGPLGERAPELAIETLRFAAPHLRVGQRFSRQLRARIMRSDLVWRNQIDDEEEYEEANPGPGTAEHTAGDPVSDTTREDVPPPSEDTEAERKTLQRDGDDEDRAASRGLDAARFLEAVGNWIDEKCARDDSRGLLNRQSAIWVLLTTLWGMPVYKASAEGRLSLDELETDVARWSPSIRDAVMRGLVRAAVARPRRDSGYLALRHLQLLLKHFAARRAESPHRADGTEDAFLRLVADLHRRVEARDPGREAILLRYCGRHLSVGDRDFILGKTLSITETPS